MTAHLIVAQVFESEIQLMKDFTFCYYELYIVLDSRNAKLNKSWWQLSKNQQPLRIENTDKN